MVKHYSYLFTLAVFALSIDADGQLNQLGARFYQNQYLSNPAMAGAADSGWDIHLGTRKLFGEITEGAGWQSVSASYRFRKVGLAINASNNKIGLFQRFEVGGTYSYHLSVDGDKKQVHMGLSFGVLDDRIDEQAIVGDAGDPLITRFNNDGLHADCDLGFAFTNERLNLQFSFPNLGAVFHNGNLNASSRTVFFSAISYEVDLGGSADAISIEPKLCYTVFQGDGKSVVDAGANLSFMDKRFSIQSIYHSSRSITAGFNFWFHSKLSLLGLYNSGLALLGSQVAESFEVGVQLAL